MNVVHSERPPHIYGDVYDNTVHFFDPEAFDFLAHNQDHYGVHKAKGYRGYVYATAENGELVWWEEVYCGLLHLQTVYGPEYERLVNYVTETHGYA